MASKKQKKWECEGLDPAGVNVGDRVRYYPVRGDSYHSVGRVRELPWENVNGLWVTNVVLDKGRTIYSAHLDHLSPEAQDAGQ